MGRDADAQPYWSDMGWRRRGSRYSGRYAVGSRRLEGDALFRGPQDCRFSVTVPLELMAACREAACFRTEWGEVRNGWMKFHVHFQRPPRDVSSGILAVEALMGEAAQAMEALQ